MIITRTPLRITLAGGGTDSSEFLEHEDGFAITASINQYIYVCLNETFDRNYRIKYSNYELVDNISDIEHNIIREALRLYDIPPGIEIVNFADIPSGTGLGSSGAFTVGLLHALSVFTGKYVSQDELGYCAAQLELVTLGMAGGAQDHYACALGGLNRLTFHPNYDVDTDSLPISKKAKRLLESRLMLFYTGYRRDAESVLSTQSTSGLSQIKQIAKMADAMLQVGDLSGFGQTLNAHWDLKKSRSDAISNSDVDTWYKLAMENGALGGKLVGAGGGGFMLFYSEDQEQLSSVMEEAGLSQTRFKFDEVGTVLIAND